MSAEKRSPSGETFLRLSLVPKWVKWLLAIALLPVCVGAGQALWLVIRASGDADTTWVPFLAGTGCWIAVFLLLPKPMWVYVVGHELTHVLWTWLFGGRVKRFRASSRGGQVAITKSNFLIALAPYFFPLYAVLVILAFVTGHLIFDWTRLLAWFHLLLGAAYAFHVTLTWHALQTEQTDITGQGRLFSAVVIFLGNVTVLLLSIPLLAASVDVPTTMTCWWKCTLDVLRWLGRLAQLPDLG